jgi:hypothetical protein
MRLDLCGRPVPAEDRTEECRSCKLEVPFGMLNNDLHCDDCTDLKATA